MILMFGASRAAYAFTVLLELVHRGEMSLETMVKKTSHSVAERFQIVDRGYIREGHYADIVLIDPNATTQPMAEHCHSRCGWTPFEGDVLHGRVMSTFVSGHLAHHHGEIDDACHGMRLEFNREA